PAFALLVVAVTRHRTLAVLVQPLDCDAGAFCVFALELLTGRPLPAIHRRNPRPSTPGTATSRGVRRGRRSLTRRELRPCSRRRRGSRRCARTSTHAALRGGGRASRSFQAS